jgi:hypothetical protein
MKLHLMLLRLAAFISISILVSGKVLASDQGGVFKKPESASEIPKEPGWKNPSYRGWESLSVPGLVATYYDLDLDHELDYMVIRKVIRKASADDHIIQFMVQVQIIISRNQTWNTQ